MITDWAKLAKKTGLVDESGSEKGGCVYAQKALDEILGDEWIETTVEHILSHKTGGELALNCLCYIHSAKAVNYAYYIYKTSKGEKARDAVWLIKHLANPISYKWIEEFLNDKNVIDWGVGVLDQLLFSEKIQFDKETELLLELANNNSNGVLLEQVNFIKSYIKDRKNQ